MDITCVSLSVCDLQSGTKIILLFVWTLVEEFFKKEISKKFRKS